MIYALHIIIIPYVYFVRSECVVCDKNEYLNYLDCCQSEQMESFK